MSANAVLRRSSRTKHGSTHALSTDSDTESSSPRTTKINTSVKRKRSKSSISTPKSADRKPSKRSKEETSTPEPEIKPDTDNEDSRPSKKFTQWRAHSKSSPFPNFNHPTRQECEQAFHALKTLHQEDVEKEFQDENTPKTIPHVLDAMIVAILSQATGWSNAKRAMNSLKATYGSIFAYDKILSGGKEKLQEALKCGGLHVRKSMIITTLLEQVKSRHGEFNLDHLKDLSDEDAMKELLSYKYMGPKSASIVMTWSLKRSSFTVDVHIYRIAGLWGWRPEKATKELTQAHLFARIPREMQDEIHFLLIAHGRACPACRGGAGKGKRCTVREAVEDGKRQQ